MFLLDSISAQRTSSDKNFFDPIFYQHRKVYLFSKKYCRDKTVLEIGCGEGLGAYEMSKIAKSVVAIDKDEGTIRKNKKTYVSENLSFLAGPFEETVIEGKFDVILVFQFIEHVKNIDLVLEKIINHSKKGSLAIFSTPSKTRSSFAENPYHFREYNSKELLKILSKYFGKVKIYGLFGDDHVEEYEGLRKKQVMRILNLDKLRLRRLLPRAFLQILFDIASFYNKKSLVRRKNDFSQISERNYKVFSKTRHSLDLISLSYVK